MRRRRITVAFDVLSDVPGQSGQVNIHRNVLRHMPLLRPDWRFMVYSTLRLRRYYEEQLGTISPNVEWCTCWWDNADGSFRRMATQEVQIPCLLRRLNPDVFLSYPLPFVARFRTGITINRHTRPMLQGGIKTRYGNLKATYSIRHATCTIFNSATEEAKLLREGIGAPRSAVIPEACDDRIFNDKTARNLRQLILTWRGFLPLGTLVFIPTGLQPRKNSEVVLQAARLLGSAGVRCRFVFMGLDDSAYARHLVSTYPELFDEQRVVALGHRAHEDVAAVGVLADLVVYPSTVETFGIPPLEMMRLRKPVILSDLEVLAEVAGPGAMMFNRFSPEDLAAKISALLGHPASRSAIADRGFAHSHLFSWEKNVTATVELIEHLLEGKD